MFKKIISILVLFLIMPLCFSCGNMKKATYFYGIGDSSYVSSSNEFNENILRNSDLLSIFVSSVNQEAAELFNSSNQVATSASTTGEGSAASASGYLIDKEGLIRFPILGEIMAAGKTKKQLRDEITQQLVDKKLLIDPIVDVRYLNFRVSVLGEVARPDVLTVPSEKISIFEALSLAGDITIFGNKEQVAILREVNGKKTLHRIDLTASEIFSSPYFYLQSNDVIYVEPRAAKVVESSAVKPWIPVILSAMSLAIITIVNFQ